MIVVMYSSAFPYKKSVHSLEMDLNIQEQVEDNGRHSQGSWFGSGL